MVTLKPGPVPKPTKAARGRAMIAKNREACFARDGYRCLRCGRGRGQVRLEADHRLNRSQGGSDELYNLQTLCTDCHRWKTEHPEQALAAGWSVPPTRTLVLSSADPMGVALMDVAAERGRQEEKWGDQSLAWRRDPSFALAVLAEEFGEVAKAVLEGPVGAVREELVQTAAVAVAFIEAIDRHGGAS